MMQIGDVISFVSGVTLMFFGCFVLVAFWPRRAKGLSASDTLSRAIFIACLCAVANTVYWQVLSQPAIALGFVTVAQVRSLGDYLDLLFKGGAAFALYLHLRALHSQLPPGQREKWGVLEVAFYPNRRRCVVRLLRRWRGFNKS